MIDFSSESYSDLLDTGTPGISREIYSENANGKIRRDNYWVINPMLYPLSYTAQNTNAGKDLNLASWCNASSYIHHFSTVIDFKSEKYSGLTGQRNSWYL